MGELRLTIVDDNFILTHQVNLDHFYVNRNRKKQHLACNNSSHY